MTAFRASLLGRDARGISGVLAVIFAFAILASFVVLLQVSAVPAWNHAEEFHHTQQVQSDMVALDDIIGQVADTGVRGRTSVAAGVDYTDRPLLLNPPAAEGHLKALPPANASISNVRAIDSSGRYWTGGVHTFETQAIAFVPTYNELDDEATTVHEGHTLFVRHENGAERVVDHTFIDGNRVTLVFLEGDVATHRTDLASVSVVPVSVGGESFHVDNDIPVPIRLELPTYLSNESWNAHVAGTYATVVDYSPPSGDAPGLVVIDLATTADGGPSTYDLRLLKVGVGDDWGTPVSKYIVAVEGNNTEIPLGGTQRAVVEVRDEFNNPVSGELVEVRTDGTHGTVVAVGGGTEAVTDERGRATFRYTATATGADTFVVDAPAIGGDLGNATFVVTVVGPSGETDGDGDTPDDPDDTPPEFDIVDGGVVPDGNYTGTVEVIAVAIREGGDGERIPVYVEVGIGDTIVDPWPQDLNTQWLDDGNTYSYELGVQTAGTPVTVVASTAFRTVHSTDVDDDPQLVYVLRDGDSVPDVAGYKDQQSVGGYLVEAGLVDTTTNTIVLADNQAIYLFELGTTKTSSGAFDLQDAVVVVTLASA